MKYVIFSLVTIMLTLTAYAEDNMTFHGTLVAPPCTVNNGQTIEVAFGNDLGVNKIDGVNYMKPVEYRVTCEAGYTATGLAIVIDTTAPAAFDASAVTTNKTGLGLRILVDNQPVTFGQRMKIDNPESPPQIQAVPVQDAAVTLTEGAFEATFTLRTDYM